MKRLPLLIFFFMAVPLLAQDRFRIVPGVRPGGGEIKWSAARQEIEKDEYAILEGNVKMEYQDITVQAERVTYNQKTKDVVAEGNVIIDQGPTRVTANRAIYNLESKTGTFFSATGTMDPQMFFAADRIEKVDEDTYRLTQGVVTSCELDRPAWSFHIGHADITVNDYAYMSNVSFRTRGLPLLWTPRLIWPTKGDRSQGLLIPRLQFSDAFGTRLELGYFIPFGDSADATVTADVNEQGYYGAGVNVRYLPSRNVTLGDLFAYGVRDVRPVDPALPSPEQANYQWRYRYQHSQENLPGGFRAVVDIEDFSNLDFFREYERDPRLHTLSQVYSSAYLTKNRPKYSLNILADRREFLLPQLPVQRFEQLPALQLRIYPQRIGRTPLYFALESSASQLQTNTIGSTTLPDDLSYFRSDVFPTISMQMRTPAWFSIRPQISLRSTYYTTSLDRDPVTARPAVNEESVDRFYAQGQVEVVGPSFSRIFNRSAAGFSRFKHVIEPRFRYLYTSEVRDQERIIRFDTVDSPFLPIVRDSVEYSLTQRIIGKESKAGGSAREVMSIALRQSVALSKKFESATGVTFGEEHKFTPLVATVRVNPYQSITIDANATVGNVSRQLDQTSFSANLVGTGKNADKYFSLTWFASFEDPETNRTGSSQFRINVGSSLWQDRIRGDVQLNYDATTAEFLEQRYILGVTGSCYGIAVGARRFRIFGIEGEEERWSADVALTLKNVGTIGSLK